MIYFKRKLWTIFLAAGIFFSPHQSLLFGENQPSEYKINREFFKNFGDDCLGVFVSPKDWQKRDSLIFSAVLTTGFLLSCADRDVHQWVQNSRSPSSDDFFQAVTLLGDGRVIFGLVAVSYASGEIFNNRSLRKTALLSLESWVAAGLLVGGLKFAIGRARPETGESSHSFHPFSMKSRFNSFPSGHSASAFAVATTIAEQSEQAYLDILAYSLAAFVALSRVHNNKHWPSDVFIGSCLGHFVAKKISALNRNRDAKQLRLSVHLSHNHRSLSLSLSF